MIIQFVGPTAYAAGKIWNFNPAILFGDVKLETPLSTILLQPVEDADEHYKQALRLRKLKSITGTFTVSPKSKDYDFDDLQNDMSTMWSFFRFVTSVSIGLGPWISWKTAKKISAIQPDGGSFDPLRRTENWANFYCNETLPILFENYQTTCKDADTKDVLHRTFEFYRASTSARNFAGIETGIILAQSALELLCDFILQRHAGWSKELTKQAKGFHNRLAASSTFIGYDGEPLEKSEGVRKHFAKGQALNDYQILTKVRNSITHALPDPRLSGGELLNIWHASMFLTGLHVFYLLKYSGKMKDRRQIDGWFGDTIPIPLKAFI